MGTPVNYDRLAPILVAVGMAEATAEPVDAAVLAELASECEVSEFAIRSACAYADATGLAHLAGGDPAYLPRLMHAGRQYLALRGDVGHDVLAFLPLTVDDLHARRALLQAGALLVDEFRHAVLAGRAKSHAAGLVPRAFAEVVTERIAVDLFAAAVALMARLEAEQPAACVAEEMLAAELIEHADSWLSIEAEQGVLPAADAAAARAALPSLLGLFGDAGELQMSGRREPADVTLGRHDASADRPAGVDVSVEAWFRPFAGAAPTGYLAVDAV